MARKAALLGGIGLSLTLVACGGDKAPTGQVIASVNGEDITRRDMQAELQAAKAPKDADIKALQPAIADRLVNRKLMVAEAKKQGIDKTPEYLAAEQRQRELLLASLLADRWAGKVEPAQSSAVDAYIAANPQMFANRKILAVDQIRAKADAVPPKELEPLTTNDQVAALLQARKAQFQRGRGTLDTATIPAPLAQQIMALAPGMPFVVVENGLLVSNSVLAVRDAPVPEAQRPTLATQVMRQQEAQKTIEAQVKSLKTGAKIEYQPGFAPPAAKAVPKAATN